MISKEAKREYDRKRRADPEFRERKNKRERERSYLLYHTSADFRATRKEAVKKWRKKLSEERKAATRERDRARTLLNRRTELGRRREMLTTAKTRSKSFGLPFDLTLEDIQIPEVCPVLGIKIQLSGGDSSPSLDRINNDGGYVRGNVKVISYRANRLKNDGTLAEHEAVVRYMREHLEYDVFSAPHA